MPAAAPLYQSWCISWISTLPPPCWELPIHSSIASKAAWSRKSTFRCKNTCAPGGTALESASTSLGTVRKVSEPSTVTSWRSPCCSTLTATWLCRCSASATATVMPASTPSNNPKAMTPRRVIT